MMPELFLTPAAISYLTQFLLVTIITVYLAARTARYRKSSSLLQNRYLLAVFVSLIFLCLLFFLEFSLLPSERVIPFSLENTAVAILLAALIQFSYHFPAPDDSEKIDRYIALCLSSAYILMELGFFIQQLHSLSKGLVIYRSSTLENLMMIGFCWVVLAFAIKSIRHWQVPAVRSFTFIMLIPLAVAFLTNFQGIHQDITILFPILSSIGLTSTVFLFVLNYLSSQEEQTSFIVKISGAALTSVLTVLGIIPWLVASPYADHYTAPVMALDHRTIHFRPDGAGGYIVDEIPFRWENVLGEEVQFIVSGFAPQYDFDFPFFGQRYRQINIAARGSIGLGEPFYEADTQYHFTTTPMIFLMVTDMWGLHTLDSGVFFRKETGKAVITWSKLIPNFPSPSQKGTFTFQAVLFGDGSFDITYNGMPDLKFYPSAGPAATAWVVGVKPVKAPSGTASFTNLPMHIGPQGALQDEYRDFRIYLHMFLLPLAFAVIVSSLVFLAGSALLLNFGLARPLKTLLEGVQNFNMGKHDIRIPIQSNDEIGFLTASFNDLSGELYNLIQRLEQRVIERTRELTVANTRLRSEIEARTAAQAQVVEQQRALAALEERERLARDLHDGIGQVLGFINVQAQSAEDAVRAGDKHTASQLLARVVEVAQEAHDDVRGYILGLKKNTPTQPPPNFISLLEDYCQHLQRNFGFETRLRVPPDLPAVLADNGVENQLLYIIREALSNARTHSGQKMAEVTLTVVDETNVQAVIQDHGLGFSPLPQQRREKSGHFGLEIMRDRATQSGGSLVIETSPDNGTCVTVRLPRRLQAAAKDRRALLVDDHPLFLEGMANLMAGRGVQVVGFSYDGLDAQEKARALCPDFILMDIEMPRCNGLEATRRIKSENSAVKVIMLTVSGEERHLFEALQSGASGYLLKSLSAAELTTLLDELLRGEVSLSPALAGKMLEAFTSHKAPPAQAPVLHPKHEQKAASDPVPVELTGRQEEILRLVAQGLMYKEIAAQLGLAEVTIKYHMGEILTRLHLNSRREAVKYFQDSRRTNQG